MTRPRKSRTALPPASRAAPHLIAAFKEADARLAAEAGGKFVKWNAKVERRPDMRDDPFIALVRERYRADHERDMANHGRAFIATFGAVCRYYGLRFFSISRRELIGFEGLRYRDGVWPLEWHITEELGISFGAGNSCQHQVSLPHLPDEVCGVYDNRADRAEPIWIAPPLDLFRMRSSVVASRFDVDDVRGHLAKCRA